MRANALVILFAFAVLPGAAMAQSASPAIAPEAAPATQATAPPSPAAPPSVTGITRDQYIERAEHSAGVRAGHRFDRMDTNHDGILTPAEISAFRQAHPRHYHKRTKAAAPAPQ
jgi:hypothetical protein